MQEKLAQAIVTARGHMKRAEIDSKEAENKEHHASSDPMTGLALLAIEARLAAMAEIILAFAEMAGEDA